MATIDIIVAVNAGELVKQVSSGNIQSGTQNAPTNLGAWNNSDVFIAMISENQFATDDQGKSELKVSAQQGDTVKWSITTFGRNVNHSAYIYSSNFNPGTALEDVSYDLINTTQYFPSGSNPLVAPSQYANQVVYKASAAVITSSDVTVQYSLSFALYDNSTGEAVGYFMWDPFIDVKSSAE